MSSIQAGLGTFKAVYVGDYGSSDKMKRIYALRTKGSPTTDEMPEEWCPETREWDPAGDRKFTATINFISTNELVDKLLRGQSVTETDPDAPPGRQLYQFLLIHNDSTRPSYFISRANVVKKFNESHLKSEGNIVTMEIQAQERDAEDLGVYRKPIVDLVGIIGAASPVG